MDTHRFEVREISIQIQAFYEKKKPFRVYHGSTYSTRAMHDSRAVVHTADLNRILDINTESRFAMVEPNVHMDKLVRETLKHGLMPPIVPVFPGTTVGGTFGGTAGSSASFKYGFFERAISWLEIVLPDGEITKASRQQNPELLQGMIGTLGTIGIVTLLQIRLVPAAKFVNLTYLPVESTTEALDTINRCSQDLENDFVEGLIYGEDAPTYGVIAVGKLSTTKTHQETHFSGAQDPWFYQHAEEVGHAIESIPINDYLFRFDRACFCLGRLCFGRMPLNKWTRWLTDAPMHSRNLTQTAQTLQWSEHFVLQDVIIPIESTYDILRYLKANFQIYPLRLCPIRQWPENHAIMRPNPLRTNLFMGVGIRGYTEDTIVDPIKFKEKHRDMERIVWKLGGIKWLHSVNFYSEKEFWETYPRVEYETLRVKCNAQYLASVYDKIKGNEKRTRASKPKTFWDHVFARTSVLAMRQDAEARKA